MSCSFVGGVVVLVTLGLVQEIYRDKVIFRPRRLDIDKRRNNIDILA